MLINAQSYIKCLEGQVFGLQPIPIDFWENDIVVLELSFHHLT